MVDGLAGQPQPGGHLDDAGHEPLGPADVDVPPVQVGNQPRQGSLVKRLRNLPLLLLINNLPVRLNLISELIN